MNHDDLLNADNPTSEDSRMKLLDAVKQRAKGAFTTKDMPSAEKLYGKAISICERKIENHTYSKDLHLLYSNRAAVRLLLKKWDSALSDCESSLDIDAGFIKSHFRKCQALMGLTKYDAAIECCDHALELHPSNNELLDLKKQASAAKEEANNKPAENGATYRPVRPEKVVNSSANGEGGAESSSSTNINKDKKKSEDKSLRGYKTTADGKTTSYFHTELDADAKRLMGDCKPKKIDPALDDTKIDAKGNSNSSAWNSAGTFEERNQTSFFTDTVKAECKGSIVINTDYKISFSVSNTSGDASITSARGKTKIVHDFCVTFKYSLKSLTSEEKIVSGTVQLESDGDVSWDLLSLECPGNGNNATERDIIKDYIKHEKKGLQPELVKRLCKCEDILREKAGIKK